MDLQVRFRFRDEQEKINMLPVPSAAVARLIVLSNGETLQSENPMVGWDTLPRADWAC